MEDEDRRAEVLAVLRMWAFDCNRTRVNVMREGVKGDYKVRMLKAKIDEAEEEMDRCDRTPS